MRLPPPSQSASRYALDLARAFTIGALALTAVVAAVIAVYAIKSKLGINLMHGPSPLHGVFVSMRHAGLV